MTKDQCPTTNVAEWVGLRDFWRMEHDVLNGMEEAEAARCGDAFFASWCEARGEWERAHELAQRAGSREGDWVHAYLHRVEGDEANAGYWYARAGRRMPVKETELAVERAEIAAALRAAAGAKVGVEKRGRSG